MIIENYEIEITEAYNQIKEGNIRPIEDILKMAQKGYPLAEFMLGELNEMYFDNIREALKWYKAAASHGYEKAMEKYLSLLNRRNIRIEKKLV